MLQVFIFTKKRNFPALNCTTNSSDRKEFVSPTSSKCHQSILGNYLIQIMCLKKDNEMKGLYSKR